MTRRSFRRRLVATALVVGAASAALAIAGPDALVPFKDAAGAATEVGVAFVIDFGGSGAPVAGCVKVPSSDNGYEALAAFTQQEHLAAPVFASSGLLCSIDNIPTSTAAVCGRSIAGGYQFWSYWYMTNGSGQWTYSDRGASVPVGNATDGQDVEGWRFQNPGPDNATAPPPRAAPEYAGLCASVSASTTTTTAPPATTPPTTGPPATAPSAAAPRTTTPPATAPPSTVTTVPPASSTTTTTAAAAPATTTPGPGGKGQALSAIPASAHRSGGSDPLPLVIGGLLVVALAAAAVIGWRRRAGTP
jgi:hypothetical protein